MVERRSRDAENDAVPDSGTGSVAGTPRWVKVFALVAAAVAVLFVITLVTGIDHGPGRHAPSDSKPPPGETGGHTEP